MTRIFDLLSSCIHFEWDEHNSKKNWLKHQVSPSECEEIFFNRPLVIEESTKHLQSECRFYSLGHTDAGRFLFVVFTVRMDCIRVISARDMHRKERQVYKSYEEKSS